MFLIISERYLFLYRTHVKLPSHGFQRQTYVSNIANANTGKNDNPKAIRLIYLKDIRAIPPTIAAAKPLNIAEIVDILHIFLCDLRHQGVGHLRGVFG